MAVRGMKPARTTGHTRQSNGKTEYHVVNGECSCKDFPKAPGQFCKHRLARVIYKRAKALTAEHEKLQALDAEGDNGHQEPAREAPLPLQGLPKAPASVNLYLEISGRKAQLTLRDCDEHRLLARLDALLQRFPLPEEEHAEPEVPEGWCRRHDVQIAQQQRKRLLVVSQARRWHLVQGPPGKAPHGRASGSCPLA